MGWQFNPFTGTFDQVGSGGGGSTSPGGSSLQLQYNNAGAFGGMSGTSWDDTNRALTITGATVATSKPVFDLSQTWNAPGVTFTGLKFNATDTASAAGSLLLDLQVGGASKFRFGKDGTISSPTGSLALSHGTAAGAYIGGPTVNLIGIRQLAQYSITMDNTVAFGWGGITGVGDTTLYRDAANTLALRNSTNAQSFRVYNTFTDASNNEYGTFDWSTSANVLTIGTAKNGTGSARAVQFAMGGTNIAYFSTSGHLLWNTNNTYDIGANAGNRPRTVYAWTSVKTAQLQCDGNFNGYGGVQFGSGTSLNSSTDGILTFTNLALNGFNRLNFGGTTSSFPALKCSSATLICRLADDSANAAFEALSVKTSAPAGGTSGTWKVGVYNATAPSATGYVEVDIGGTLYKLLAST